MRILLRDVGEFEINAEKLPSLVRLKDEYFLLLSESEAEYESWRHWNTADYVLRVTNADRISTAA